MLTLKDHVAGVAEFQYYRAGNLMYKTSTDLEFPIPVSDTNDATFPRTEKGIFFMRWIRKHLDSISLQNLVNKGDLSFAPGFRKQEDGTLELLEVSLVSNHSQNKFTP